MAHPFVFLGLLKFPSPSFYQTVRNNSNRVSICRIGRQIYTKQYPTVLVFPDGSTINIRYHEPRKIIKLPVDLNKLGEEEKKLRLERHKPKETFKTEEDIDDEFDAYKYIKIAQRK